MHLNFVIWSKLNFDQLGTYTLEVFYISFSRALKASTLEKGSGNINPDVLVLLIYISRVTIYQYGLAQYTQMIKL